eukprot:12043657-Alexandrium_andersonii.AAC.1
MVRLPAAGKGLLAARGEAAGAEGAGEAMGSRGSGGEAPPRSGGHRGYLPKDRAAQWCHPLRWDRGCLRLHARSKSQESLELCCAPC